MPRAAIKTYIEKCTRNGCNKIATWAWVNGASCDKHQPEGSFASPLSYTPEQLDAYRQGWADAFEAVNAVGDRTP